KRMYDTTYSVLSIQAYFHVPVLLSGYTFGCINLINHCKIQKLSKAPVIVVVGSRPNNRAVKRALSRHFPDWQKRWDLIRSLGPLHKIRTMAGEGPVFFERFGCPTRQAGLILMNWSFVSRMPESLRVEGI